MCGNRRRLWLISLKTTMATKRGTRTLCNILELYNLPLAGFLANSHLASNCEWRNEL